MIVLKNVDLPIFHGFLLSVATGPAGRRRQAAWGQDLKDGGQLIDFDGAVAVEVESAIAQGPEGSI